MQKHRKWSHRHKGRKWRHRAPPIKKKKTQKEDEIQLKWKKLRPVNSSNSFRSWRKEGIQQKNPSRIPQTSSKIKDPGRGVSISNEGGGAESWKKKSHWIRHGSRKSQKESRKILKDPWKTPSALKISRRILKNPWKSGKMKQMILKIPQTVPK